MPLLSLRVHLIFLPVPADKLQRRELVSDKELATIITIAQCVNSDITDPQKVREIYREALQSVRENPEPRGPLKRPV
jgi:hypothetical protein